MKKTRLLIIALILAGTFFVSACHITEPPCPAYVDNVQITEQNS